jgi:hypothetical protein
MPPINDLKKEKLFEFCAIEFKIKNVKYLIGGVYRTPSHDYTTFLNSLDVLLNIIAGRANEIILAGDFNIDILTDTIQKQRLLNVFKSYGMVHTVNIPTRVTHSTATAIDNIFISNHVHNYEVESFVTALSDHDGQLLSLNIDSKKINNNLKILTTKIRRFEPRKMVQFTQDIGVTNWSSVYFSSVEEKFSNFSKTFCLFFEKHFPVVNRRIYERKNEWIDDDVRAKRKTLIDKYIKAKLLGSEKGEHDLKMFKREYKTFLNARKKEHYNSKLKKSACLIKATWKIINNETKGNINFNSKNIVIKHNGILLSEPQTVANVFNEHFTQWTGISSSLVDGCGLTGESNNKMDSPFDELSRFTQVEENDVLKIIDDLKNKFSTGYDDIPITLIKASKHILIKPLTHLINSSFITGEFPSQLKISKVVPVFKKGDRTDITNYRPIALQSVISKIFEKSVLGKLMDHFSRNNLLDDQQHGFRNGRSTITAGIHLVEGIIDNINKGNNVSVAFLDLSKAFERVCHSTLLEILSNNGIKGKAWKWLESYLVNRFQFVEIPSIDSNGSLCRVRSKMLRVETSVPQGSILGPFLFICYLGGLPHILSNPLNSNLSLYADDISLKVCAGKASVVDEIIVSNVGKINEFLNNRNLVLNLEKSNKIVFRFNHGKDIDRGNTSANKINEAKFYNFLGIVIDDRLNWNEHIKKIRKKICSGLFVLRRMSFLCDIPTLKMIYFAHIESHIRYGILLYGGTTTKNLNEILLLQKKAIRIIYKLKSQESCRPIFQNSKFFTVFSLYIFESVVYVKSNWDSLTKLGQYHTYNTRNKNNPSSVYNKLKIADKTPKFNGLKFFDKLPRNIKMENDIVKFRKSLKMFLLGEPLYSFEEFFRRCAEI